MQLKDAIATPETVPADLQPGYHYKSTLSKAIKRVEINMTSTLEAKTACNHNPC